jgi:hypothetical protein
VSVVELIAEAVAISAGKREESEIFFDARHLLR